MSLTNENDQLTDPEAAAQWLKSLGVEDSERGLESLTSIRRGGLNDEMFGFLCSQLASHLPDASDRDSALANLDRFIAASRSPQSLVALFERDRSSFPTLLRIFSTSQYLADQLVRAPDSFDLVRITDGQPVAYQVLIDDLLSDLSTARDEEGVMRVLRVYKQRETLRIAYGDFIREAPLERVTQQISFLADAITQGAVIAAQRLLEDARGFPVRLDGRRARLVVLALGKLGGSELNYSSDIDLMFLCDEAEKTNGTRSIPAAEYFERLTRMVIRLLDEPTELGSAYRVDLRIRPHGENGPPVSDIASAIRYYDSSGRTWDRQALIKARPIAGDLDLGHEFLSALKPWIYRRFLSRVDIAGIRHIKRRIEKRAKRAGDEARNVKTGHGGIRDIEFSIQFLQLLNGADLEPVRTGNTLNAIDALQQVGCLTPQEATVLSENYKFLRSVEHHLQIMFDLETHTIPSDPRELTRFCWRMGYRDADGPQSVAAFGAKLAEMQLVNRRILDHLLHDAFGDEEQVPIETELVLDPDPSDQQIAEALQPFEFADPKQAYQLLMELANEKIPFLSTRRCRHFLAAIAPRLLASVAKTPDPSLALENMVRVSDSLGGKSALWELASFAPATLEMVVRLSAVGPYLIGILTSNPGMIDELMDSLILNRLPSYEELDSLATEMCRGAEDVPRILFSFRNSVHLRVGVRDVLGKDDIQSTHQTLADCAEICIHRIVQEQYEVLARRFGDPQTRDGRPCDLVILAVGKLGGREPNYHSDLDLMFLYESEGHTRPRRGGRSEGTTNNHFFNQLCQRATQLANAVSPQGRLYHVDTKLRPSGGSSILAVPFAQLVHYFAGGSGTLWERLSLCKARPIYGSPEARNLAMQSIREVVNQASGIPDLRDQVWELRQASQCDASAKNLKRSAGGTMDVELIVQMLQLQHAAQHPEVLVPGTLGAIESLRRASILDGETANQLEDGYAFLRRVESALRLLNTPQRHDLPTDEDMLGKLVYLLGFGDSESLIAQCESHQRMHREIFQRVCNR
ncbi:Glutamate-ammonia-ligase adenylyltransferase [Rosistilla carotiformis]|uniref:Glutamate-ammonia-ligase adenylyltransferase n=1 Tax=Rosistilla carotiformis TaxID=2528017 RepID=A0A518JTK1_9BACT|nr:bifunctional [glutamate--ammonia ligase]-adenylyl-L-tyrosine phosphorylase/[glutamate--ammonia-ligase] adenylyltransferase [Rosistilla carotiformis]QDV68865.1 Glutamate-ammonia-ligase adenylyltransferase [Rosistilla carotiformis]